MSNGKAHMHKKWHSHSYKAWARGKGFVNKELLMLEVPLTQFLPALNDTKIKGGGEKLHTHLNKDKIESNLSVPGIQGHQEIAIKSFEMSPHLICL